MGFSIASVMLSYFLIAGGTFVAALLAGRIGLHSEYLGYIVLAIGGFLGGMLAARASKGSTIVEPAVGAVLLLATFIAAGLAASGSSAGAVLLPSAMKAIALTSVASAGGGVAGAFVTEKMLGDRNASGASWILIISVAAFGAGVIATTLGTVIGKGDSGPMFGLLALCCLIAGVAAGASAPSRPLGAAFLGGLLGLGGFFFLAIYVFVTVFSSHGAGAKDIPSEVYTGIVVIALVAGIVALIGAAIGWAAVGKKHAQS